MPKVSIVVPVYKVEEFLPKCLDSILAQTYKDFELIIVDDGSPDNCPQICDDYSKLDDRIKVIHQENKGLGGARNTGASQAAGEYILFIDSDDYIEPDLLETALKNAIKTDADILVYGFRTVNESGRQMQNYTEPVKKNIPLSPQSDKSIFLIYPNAWNKLYKRELFEQSGILYPSNVWYEDLRTTLKLFLFAQSIVFIDDILYNYLIRQGSIMQNSNIDRNRELFDAIDDLIDYFKSIGKYEDYKNELEFVTIYNALISGTIRILKIDKNHPVIKEFYDYTEKRFPGFRQNPYIKGLDKKRKLIYQLIIRKQYGILKLLLNIKG